MGEKENGSRWDQEGISWMGITSLRARAKEREREKGTRHGRRFGQLPQTSSNAHLANIFVPRANSSFVFVRPHRILSKVAQAGW